ncbi:RNA polymerase sigma factor [compost metagenome]
MEVFSKFWLKREGAVEIVSLSSFLYSSVRNACIDLLRKEKRSTLLFHEASDQIFDQNDIVEGEEIFARLLQQVLDNIESLPTQCKTIFKLIYLEGKTTTVVAEMLGLSIQSVRNQKARGLNLLRQKIKPTHLLSLMLVQITLLHI